MKKMAKYFTLAEMLKSETAAKNNIQNTPSVEVQQNIEELLEVLDDLREFYGKPIKITSGYRCTELNRLVGGSPTSAHVIGYAADLQPIGDTFENFKAEVLRWLDTGVKFDQCIIEKSKSAQWVHFGLFNRKGQQRGQRFSLQA